MTSLDGIDRLLIDGNNLLHRVSGGVDSGSLRLLLAKLSGAIPAELPTVVMLDGHAASGTDRRQRIRRGLEIHHAGSISADDALLNVIKDLGHGGRAGAVIVTDDRALTEKARHLGARTKRLDWLEQIMEHPPRPGAGTSAGSGAGSSIGRKGVPPSKDASKDDEERQPWSPGRGATTKHGNPRKSKH
jgi:rRNA-processing protein FCF1